MFFGLNIKISSRNCFSRRSTRKTTNLNIIFSIYFFDWTAFVSPNVYERRDSDLHHPVFWLFIVLRYICCSLLLLVVLSTNIIFRLVVFRVDLREKQFLLEIFMFEKPTLWTAIYMFDFQTTRTCMISAFDAQCLNLKNYAV
jgi:hypothetical protein